MGVIVNKKTDQNDELSKRINADLRAKAYSGSDIYDGDDPDLAEDAEYLKDLNKTSRFGWIWIVLIVLAILSLLSIIFF